MDTTLTNSGVICYFNSLLQALWGVESFSKHIEDSNELFDFIKKTMSSGGVQDFSAFIDELNKSNKAFTTKKQVDPSEAHFELIKLMPELLKRKFSYTVENNETEKEFLRPLELRIHERGKKFIDLMDSLTFRLTNVTIKKNPKILVLTINRITNSNVSLATNQCLKMNGSTFKLKSVICRLGRTNSGHAFCIRQNNERKWASFNDDSMIECGRSPLHYLDLIYSTGIVYFFEIDESLPLEMKYIDFCTQGGVFNIYLKGFLNHRSNCWFNSILQNLYTCPTFLINLLRSDANIIKNIAINYFDIENSSIDPATQSNTIITGNQEDYFAKYVELMTIVSNKCGFFSQFAHNYVVHFESVDNNELQIDSTIQNDPYIILEINSKFEDSLTNFFSPNEHIKYHIESSNENHRVKIKRQLLDYPLMLSFQIKRAKYDEQGKQYVDSTNMKYPINLDMEDNYLCKESYKLHSIIIHTGLDNNGHYICLVVDDFDNVYKCNDTKIKNVGYAKIQKYGSSVVGLHYIKSSNIKTKFLHISNKDPQINIDLETNQKRVRFITIDTTKKNELNALFDNTMKINLEKQKDLIPPTIIPAIPTETLLYRDKIRTKQNEGKVNSVEVSRIKRSYGKTTLEMRNHLQKIFNKYGTDKNAAFYSLKCGIKLPTMYKFYKQLKDGTFEVHPTGHTGGRKSKVSMEYSRILEEEINRNPQTTLNQMKKLIAHYNENEAEIKLEEKDLPSKSSIHRFLHSDECKEYMGSTISFKKLSTRTTGSNDEKNLALRKVRIKELYKKICSGAMWVCVDETSWNVDFRWRNPRGWGPTGQKVYYEFHSTHFVATALTAISLSGKTFCMLMKGTTDKGIFNAFLTSMIESFIDDWPLVIWLDNCGIHNDAEKIVIPSNHSVVFNAPGSPELNPIENIFAIWKDEVEKSAKNWEDDDNIVDKIKQCFLNLDKALIRKTMESNKGEQWSKALDEIPQ